MQIYFEKNNIQTRTRNHFQEPTRKESLEDELKRVKKNLQLQSKSKIF